LPTYVIRLHKTLYDSKQDPQAWYTYLSDFLLCIGFRASKVDTSLFILFVDCDIYYLLVYVDEILLTSNNSALVQHLITFPSLEFKICDLGNAHYFFRIEVPPTSMGSCLVNTNIFLIFFVMLVCHRANLLIFWPLLLRLDCNLVSYFRTPLTFNKLLVLFSISPLLDRIYVML
jgi:hypothetical protein